MQTQASVSHTQLSCSSYNHTIISESSACTCTYVITRAQTKTNNSLPEHHESSDVTTLLLGTSRMKDYVVARASDLDFFLCPRRSDNVTTPIFWVNRTNKTIPFLEYKLLAFPVLFLMKALENTCWPNKEVTWFVTRPCEVTWELSSARGVVW